jgi:hypothetical protein
MTAESRWADAVQEFWNEVESLLQERHSFSSQDAADRAARLREKVDRAIRGQAPFQPDDLQPEDFKLFYHRSPVEVSDALARGGYDHYFDQVPKKGRWQEFLRQNPDLKKYVATTRRSRKETA